MTKEEIHTKFEISLILVKHIKCPTAEALEPLYKYLQEQLLIQNVSETLLSKYIDHVGQCEGIDFIDRVNTHASDVVFTKEEVETLEGLR